VASLYRSMALKSKSRSVALLELPGFLAILPTFRGTDTLITSMEDFATKPSHLGPPPQIPGAPALAAPFLEGVPISLLCVSAYLWYLPHPPGADVNAQNLHFQVPANFVLPPGPATL